MKKAQLKSCRWRGSHQGGGPETCELVLFGGAKGHGRELWSCQYWPWSGKSVEEAWGLGHAAAQRLGYELVAEGLE